MKTPKCTRNTFCFQHREVKKKILTTHRKINQKILPAWLCTLCTCCILTVNKLSLFQCKKGVRKRTADISQLYLGDICLFQLIVFVFLPHFILSSNQHSLQQRLRGRAVF